MNKRSIILVFLLLLTNNLLFAQKTIKVDIKERYIAYYALGYTQNGGLFRRNEELPRILLQGVVNEEIQAYQVSYDDGAVKPLSIQSLSIRLQKLNDDGNNISYTPEEISLIGLDITEGTRNEEPYQQINFLNIYIPYHHSTSTKNEYIASFRFTDILAFLDEKKIVWYSPHFGFSKGIFTNYGGYTLSQTNFIKFLLQATKDEFPGASFSESANISAYEAYRGYDVEVQLSEQRSESYHIPRELEIHKASHELKVGQESFVCKIPLEELSDYVGDYTSAIIPMSEHLLSGQLTRPSETWQNKYENFHDRNLVDRMTVSISGRFLTNDFQDPLSAGNKLEVTGKRDSFTDRDRFLCRQVEWLDLEGIEPKYNEKFQQAIDKITRQAREGNTATFRTDSLRQHLDVSNTNADPDKTNLTIKGLELIYQISFDKQGQKRQYKVVGLGFLGADSHPFGYFRFEDIKSNLPSSLLAEMEAHKLKGFIRRTSHISAHP